MTVNGNGRSLQLDPRVTLLDAVRDHLGLTGTKKGCDQGTCGACTVLVNGRRINSCLSLASEGRATDRQTIAETVIASGELITGISIPALDFASRSVYLEARDRAVFEFEFALASAAVVLASESIIVAGWVALWQPMDTLLQGWWPYWEDERTFKAVSAMRFSVGSIDARTHGDERPLRQPG